MRAAIVAILVAYALPADARCHRIWNYPWPQHCGGVYARVTQEHVSNPVAGPLPGPPVRDLRDDLPLPDLTAAEWTTDDRSEAMQRQKALRTLEGEKQ